MFGVVLKTSADFCSLIFINCLVVVMDMECVLCEVEEEFLHTGVIPKENLSFSISINIVS